MSDDVNDGRASDRAVLLAEKLVELAGSDAEEADNAPVADRLMGCSLDLLAVDAVGVQLSDPDGTVAASSDRVAAMMATVPPQGVEWPESTLESYGFTAHHSVPVRHGVHTVGTLHLLIADRSPLATPELAIAEALAAATAIAVIHRRRLAGLLVRAEQLQGALDTRIVVEQATGVLSEHAGIGMGAAFDALRQHARSRRLKLSEVAQQVVDRRLAPGEIVERRTS